MKLYIELKNEDSSQREGVFGIVIELPHAGLPFFDFVANDFCVGMHKQTYTRA